MRRVVGGALVAALIVQAALILLSASEIEPVLPGAAVLVFVATRVSKSRTWLLAPIVYSAAGFALAVMETIAAPAGGGPALGIPVLTTVPFLLLYCFGMSPAGGGPGLPGPATKPTRGTWHFDNPSGRRPNQ